MTLSGNVTVSDPDNLNLASATVAVTGGLFAGDGDSLTAVTTGTNIAAAYDNATETLTLSGSDTLANYQQVLASVTFTSSSPNPTHYGKYPTRTVTWIGNDGSASNNLSTSKTTTVDITATPPVDTTPVVTVSNLIATHGPRFVASDLFTASDPDGDVITEYDFWNTGTGGGVLRWYGAGHLWPESGQLCLTGTVGAGHLPERFGSRHAVGACE